MQVSHDLTINIPVKKSPGTVFFMFHSKDGVPF